MNRDEALRLLEQGRDAWNEWADDMSARLSELEQKGKSVESLREEATVNFSDHVFKESVDFSRFRFPGDAVFNDAKFSGDADFGGAQFSEEARFIGAVFSGDARFVGAQFSEFTKFDNTTFRNEASFAQAEFEWWTQFSEAQFEGEGHFYKARFSGYSEFNKAKFFEEAWFAEVQFEDMADFRETHFSWDASFSEATFSGNTKFDSAIFDAEADFSAIRGKTVFSLYNARFAWTPNFIQADFAQAPPVDRIRIDPQRQKFKTATEPTRWSELKRLAVQRHDHLSEMRFFRGELWARRWTEHKPWHSVFWAGYAFQVFSGFGLSIPRPLFFWAVGVLLFAGLYGAEHADRQPAYNLAPGESRFVHFASAAAWDAATGTRSLRCVDGSGAPASAAFVLSLKTALIVGAVSPGQADRARECLFGTEPVPGAGGRFRPVYPVGVAFCGALQFVWSAAMLFLLGLGLRNHFRIK